MRLPYIIALLFTAALDPFVTGQTIWNGPPITFTKPDFSDHTLPQNQDAIVAGVTLTRGATQGLFNIAVENSYTDFFSPAGTEWAFGTTANIGSLTFDDWEDTHNSNPPSMVNQPMVLHLVNDDIYIDITFLSWTTGAGGGNPGGAGFSYQRSTDPSTSVGEENGDLAFHVFPNPTNGNAVNIQPAHAGVGSMRIELFDLTGNLLLDKTAPTGTTRLDLGGRESGIYLLRITQGQAQLIERVALTR